jgi:hypothetical protein
MSDVDSQMRNWIRDNYLKVGDNFETNATFLTETDINNFGKKEKEEPKPEPKKKSKPKASKPSPKTKVKTKPKKKGKGKK